MSHAWWPNFATWKFGAMAGPLKAQLQPESKLCREAFSSHLGGFVQHTWPLLAFSLMLSVNFVCYYLKIKKHVLHKESIFRYADLGNSKQRAGPLPSALRSIWFRKQEEIEIERWVVCVHAHMLHFFRGDDIHETVKEILQSCRIKDLETSYFYSSINFI